MLALIYDLADDYLERRGPLRDEHLRLIHAAHDRGELALAGALSDPYDQAWLVWSTTDTAVIEQFTAADPYVAHGLVADWRIRTWNVVVGD
jgi:uncharacterized protein